MSRISLRLSGPLAASLLRSSLSFWYTQAKLTRPLAAQQRRAMDIPKLPLGAQYLRRARLRWRVSELVSWPKQRRRAEKKLRGSKDRRARGIPRGSARLHLAVAQIRRSRRGQAG